MIRRYRYMVPTILACAVGLVTLLSFFLDGTSGIRQLFVAWATALGAFAVLLGLFNVMIVHVRRIAAQERGWVYSMALLLAAAGVMTAGVIDALVSRQPGASGPLLAAIFRYGLVSGEAALAGSLLFFLTLAAFRALRRRLTLGLFLFLSSALIVLVVSLPLPAPYAQALGSARAILITPLATGGIRGLILGVALGSVAVGVRVLLGLERPYLSEQVRDRPTIAAPLAPVREPSPMLALIESRLGAHGGLGRGNDE